MPTDASMDRGKGKGQRLEQGHRQRQQLVHMFVGLRRRDFISPDALLPDLIFYEPMYRGGGVVRGRVRGENFVLQFGVEIFLRTLRLFLLFVAIRQEGGPDG